MRNTIVIITVVVSLLLLYAGSYLVLSLQGRYEPAAIGLSGVKFYAWEPRGFVTIEVYPKWRQLPHYAFLPLYWLDTRLWHTFDRAYDDGYPINTALEEAFEREAEQNSHAIGDGSTQVEPEE